MSDIKRLGPSDGPDDGIEDAEFEEIHEPRFGARENPTSREVPDDEVWSFRTWVRDLPPRRQLLPAVLTSLAILLVFAFGGRLAGPAESVEESSEPLAAMETGGANSNSDQHATAPGRYPVPTHCQSADKDQAIVCLQELVRTKTETLNQRALAGMENASKDQAVAQMALAKKWNDTVDTICQVQADQFSDAQSGERGQEYWACLNKFIDDEIAKGANGAYLIQRPAAPSSSFDPTSLRKGQPYSKVRQTLLANGFEPARYDQRDCSPYGTSQGEECFDRPEISGCSGSGRGFCAGYWLKGDDALSVLVAEGPDGTFEEVSPMTRSDVIATVGQDGAHLVN